MDIDDQGLPTCHACVDIDDLGVVPGDHETLVVLRLKEVPDKEPELV
jgi:hypothetical protein